MELSVAVLALLISYPVHSGDRAEDPGLRAQRLETIARSIALASQAAACSDAFDVATCRRKWSRSPLTLAALLARTALDETGLSRRIHDGRCRPMECDRGAARGLWQVHAVGPVSLELWQAIDLTPSGTLAGAWAAALIYSGAARQCRQSNVGTVSAYATGWSCNWSGAAPRVRGWISAESRLRAACAAQR